MILVVCIRNLFLLVFFFQYPKSFFLLIYFELKANRYVKFIDKLNRVLFSYIQKTVWFYTYTQREMDFKNNLQIKGND